MRKLKLQVQVSVDGYIGGSGGELDWLTCPWDKPLEDYVTGLTASMDTILLGRKMAGGFIDHWTNVANNPQDPSHTFGKIMIDTPKVVFSKTLTRSDWANTVIANGDLSEEVNKLKNQSGKDIIVYGGASFDTALISAGLIDELHLFINHTAIGKGLPIFSGKTSLQLVKATPFECGIVVLVYKPVS